MSINLRDYKYFTITDLSGGINEFASSYKVANNELVAVKNMSFKDSGGIKVRLGDELLDAGNGSDVTGGIKNMYRYVRSDGTRKTMMYANDESLWVDNDDNSFSQVGDTILSNDDHLRFSQHYDTALLCNDAYGIYMYNSDKSTSDIKKLSMKSLSNGFNITISYVQPLTVTTGGGLDGGEVGGYYYYIFTYDYQYGDFMGESSPSYTDSSNVVKLNIWYAQVSSGSANTVQIKKRTSAPYYGENIPDDIARINVYRSNLYVSSQHPENRTRKDEFFYIGSINIDAYTNADYGSVVFEDGGQAPGKLVEYSKMEVPPSGRFISSHKGRTWLANVKYGAGDPDAWANSQILTENYETHPHRVFISSLNNSGDYEPGVFYTDQFVDIEPHGSGITGIWSYRNSILVVFKANSVWAVVGDDPHPYTGNISVRNISNTVGCIAPESICEVEGQLVWLSNSGVYYWDGGSKANPLKTDNIVDTIQGMPDTLKKEIASTYDRKQRELLMAVPGPDTGGYNKKVVKFDVRTGSWSIDEYLYGIGAFCNTDEQNEASRVYAGINDRFSLMFIFGAIARLNIGTIAAYSASPISAFDIDFEFQTKFYDAEMPFMDKKFVALVIDLKTSEELDIDVLCDNRLDTRSDDTEFKVSVPSQSALVWAETDGSGEVLSRRWYRTEADDGNQLQNDNRWASLEQGTSIVYLDDRCWGKRISLIPSGAVQDPVNIDSITVFYKPLEGVREN